MDLTLVVAVFAGWLVGRLQLPILLLCLLLVSQLVFALLLQRQGIRFNVVKQAQGSGTGANNHMEAMIGAPFLHECHSDA